MQESVRPSLKEINSEKRKIQDALRILRFKLDSSDISEQEKSHILDLFKNFIFENKGVDDDVLLEKISQVSESAEHDKLWKLSEIEDVFM